MFISRLIRSVLYLIFSCQYPQGQLYLRAINPTTLLYYHQVTKPWGRSGTKSVVQQWAEPETGNQKLKGTDLPWAFFLWLPAVGGAAGGCVHAEGDRVSTDSVMPVTKLSQTKK